MDESRVNWRRISEDDFNELAQQLLLRDYNTKPGLYTRVIDGRGGDGGIDVDVRVKKTDQLAEILQLKYFPEGFSNKFIDRRKQISGSFETAMSEAPPVWTLVVPCDGTISERRHITLLGSGKAVRARFFGRSELNDLLTKYPDIEDRATRDVARAALKLVGREQAALTAPGDLASEVVSLHQRAAARSAFWDSTISFAPDGTVTEQLFAKRPDAATREPLSIKLVTQFNREHEDLRKSLVDTLNYGASKPVILPAEVVQSFTKIGPDWFAEEGGPGEVSFQPQSIRKPGGPARITSKDAAGRVLASLNGKVTNWGAGKLGGSVDVRFEGGLHQHWRFPLNHDSTATVDLRLDSTGSSAIEIQRAIRLLNSIEDQATVELSVDGLSTAATLSGSTPALEVDSQFTEMVEDMAALERGLDISFEFPEVLPTAEDRVWLRVIRHMLEGKVSIIPNAGGMTLSLTGFADEAIRSFVKTPNAIALQQEGWSMELLGRRLEVGDVTVFHQSAQVENSAVVLAELDDGNPEGLPISVVPTDGTGFRIYSMSRLPTDQEIGVEPWGINGIGEHQSLKKLQKLVARSNQSATETEQTGRAKQRSKRSGV